MGGARNAGKGLKGKGLGGSLAKRAQRHGAHVGHVAQTGYINYGTGDAGRHTTDVNPDGGGGRGGRPNLTSVMERNDMDEFFALADLANRDFTTERSKARVLSMPGGGNASGVANTVAEDAHAAADAAAQAEARADAEALHSDSLKVPRRPPWTKDMSVDQLDRNEKAAFLEWRRALAAVEEDERLTLTPFEKNLEIWRQLWRVCERSDIVVQVVDARDPLFYRCPDLEAYVTEIDAANLPLSEAARAALEGDPALLSRIVTGGDDYELAFCLPDTVEAAAEVKKLAAETGIELTRIGTMTAPPESGPRVRVLGPSGAPLDLQSGGFTHF